MSIESLYPFLYQDEPSSQDQAVLTAVLAQVQASTVAKASEIIELRAAVAKADGARLEQCARQAADRFNAGGRLFAFGNGGSATDAQQLATLFLNPPAGITPLPAYALGNDTAIVTALCNDIGVEVVFARQLATFSWGAGSPGTSSQSTGSQSTRNDIAVGLSTSGNSANLLRAFDEASRRGMLTIAMAGYDGGKLAELDSIDYLFVQPSTSIHRIQEAQTTTYQVLWQLITDLTENQEGTADVPRHTR